MFKLTVCLMIFYSLTQILFCIAFPEKQYKFFSWCFQLVFHVKIWHAVASNNGINIIQCKL